MKLIFYYCLVLHFFTLNTLVFSQNISSSKLKSEAIQLMKDGRYGEAIDLLNKYVSADPTSAEGFNLRGICYEKRGSYEYAVYDFRTAKRLNPKDDDISTNLNRTTYNWYKLLYNKIEGHKREIAINSNIAKNYLEIGKCYKNLGDWSEAEVWYDIYLEKETASSDEIIRYSEILSKNNHIAKGEPILKSYTEKFSDDHRLWSRYGYFVLWLGKNKVAIDAFSKALEIRPYFKEALDGLDLAKGKGYIYSINDTTSRFTYGMPSGVKEYTIDKYYRQLKKNPKDDETRFKLIEELIKSNRFEEANVQLNTLPPNYSAHARFKDLSLKVTTLRKSYYSDRIKYFEDQLIKNPKDKKALLELTKYYTYNNDYSLAVKLYQNYLVNNPADTEIQYQLAKVLMWQNNLCEALAVIDNLVLTNSDNKEYMLLAANINLWSDKELDYSQSLYQKVLVKDAQNKEGMIGLANVYVRQNNLTEAKKLIDKISTFDSLSNDFVSLKNDYNWAENRNKIDSSNNLLYVARKYSAKKEYSSSISIFKKYLDENPTNQSINLELADVYIANNQLNDAEKIYKNLLASGSDYDIEKRLAKVYLWSGDSLAALREFSKLYKKNPQDIETKLFLGDAYLQTAQLQNARIIYEELSLKSPNSHIIKTRLGWLGGSDKFSINNFPTYIQLIPRALYFTDNTDFRYSNIGLGFDLGLTRSFAIGFSGSRGNLSSEFENLRFNQIKGNGYVKFTEVFSGSAGFGQTYFANEVKENIIELSLSAQKKNIFSITGLMNFSDAAFILYSPFLVNTRLNAYHYSINGEYRFKNDMILSGKFSYIDVSDSNSGNQFVARIGKTFETEISAGYEYYFYTFETQTQIYWSPKNFESHSIWADWILYKDNTVDFTIGGKVGLIPKNDYLLSEFYANFSYEFSKMILLQARFTTGSSSRSNIGYRSNSIQTSLIWSL